MLKICNVTKDYRVGKNITQALKGISLEFNNKEFVSILGQSGCGKTTLLNILGGLDKSTTGEVYLNDISIKEYSSLKLDYYRNSVVGFIFQNPSLIKNLTVKENVEIALQLSGVKRKERKKLVYESLKKVNINQLSNKKVKLLSGGEQQRVAIARAIVNNPKIILADEPTGALDSENAKSVMEVLKELSKDYLVVMVTHNRELAEKYSTRIIEMLDGKVINDITKEKSLDKKEVIINKTRMPYKLSFLLSLKNLYSKLIRTILTAFAGCIGIVGVALVLSVSEGVTKYIDTVQTNALESYPIIIRSSSVMSSTGNVITNREEFPDNEIITITKTITNYEHISQIDQQFIDYLEQVDRDKYTIIDYTKTIKFKLLKKNQDSYQAVCLSYFTELVDDSQFLETQYDVISGKMPTEANEIALVVDSYNSVSASLLSALGIDYNKESYTFDEIKELTYRVIENDDYYYYSEEKDRYYAKGLSEYQTLYENSKIELKIVGILRENPNCSFPLYSSGIVYTKELTEKLLESANNSEIVKKQLEYGTEKRVLTGKPYEASESISSSMSIDYLYESDLVALGAVANVTRINIYSESFANRNYIERYIKDSNEYKASKNISYYDYMSGVSKDFATFIEILTKVLIIFALISLFVSSIMISIITYISVLERNKEIGLLRCLGARRIDIVKVFCSETVLIGLLSGVFGVILAYVLKNPINSLVEKIIRNNLSLNPLKESFVDYSIFTILLLIFGSIIITVLSGLIPAIIASFKQPAKVLKNE